MYSIGIFDNMPASVFKTIEERLGKKLLTQVTELTGGRTITADKLSKVSGISDEISTELRVEYVLAYRSSHPSHTMANLQQKATSLPQIKPSTTHP